MKTLFFIAALAATVFLIMQTPAGKLWLTNNEAQLTSSQQSTTELEQDVEKEAMAEQIALAMQNQITELVQSLTQKQTQLDQLEGRIAELENELVMSRISQNQQSANSELQQESWVAIPQVQALEIEQTNVDTVKDNSAQQQQRKRQARLQDIAEKMEMSSLQALIN